MNPLLSIPFDPPLAKGTLLKRYKRFLADVQLESGEIVTAHCVNTGSMEGLTREGTEVWLSPSANPKRKLKWTWELARVNGAMIGANTANSNRLARAALEARALPGFKRYRQLAREQRFGHNSRIDFHLFEGGREHYIEVKNIHLVYADRRAYFPDSVSERATKHLEELMEMVRLGHRATVLFTVQHDAARSVRPSDVHDPRFAETARRAAQEGVTFKAFLICPRPDALVVERMLPVDLKPYATEKIERWRAHNRSAK